MSHLPKGRTALRTAAVSAVAIATLAGASSASAALGGGKQPDFLDRPSLESVTLNNTSVDFKFDRIVDCVTAATCDATTNIALGGYSADGNFEVLATSATVTGDTVRAVFPAVPDSNAVTYGRVEDDTVLRQGTAGSNNIGDAIRVSNSDAVSGTRGHTVGPDLLSAVNQNGPNVISFTFDQNVNENPAQIDFTQFHFVDPTGNVVDGSALAGVNDDQVDITFPAGNPVAGAREAYVTPGAVETVDSPNLVGGPINNPTWSTSVGTNTKTSTHPFLASAELTAADTVVFQFDKKVAGAAANAASFHVTTADGATTDADAASIVGDGSQVEATFPTDQYSEYLVNAFVDAAAVTSQAGAQPNEIGGVAIGGNDGAQASGFTTAPDAVQSVYTGSNVLVTFDSRVDVATNPPDETQVDLLADDGSVLSQPTSAVPQAQGVPGPSVVRLTSDTDTVGDTFAVHMNPGSVFNTVTGSYLPNIDQQLGR